MKLLVLSDSHGDSALLMKALEATQDANAVLFLGDGMRDPNGLRPLTPMCRCMRCAEIAT